VPFDRRATEPAAVRAAVARRPALHRYVNEAPQWLVRAAALAARLRRFHRIGQKKSAMAVEILARDLGVPVRELSGSDIAYDVHVQWVFLRTAWPLTTTRTRRSTSPAASTRNVPVSWTSPRG
jgi:hypothetical protein